MNRTMAKERVVNNGEVETRFAGKNLTLNLVQGMKLFHKFVQKLGVEEALGQRIKLTRREGNYKTGSAGIALVCPGSGPESPSGHSSPPERQSISDIGRL